MCLRSRSTAARPLPFFFFNDTATTEIYTLSLHDALPISRHLQVLERAGLIERRIERQWRFVRVRADALAPAESWLSRQRRHWMAALDRLEAVAAAQTPKREKS